MTEPWRYNPKWGTAIDLDTCQFGFTVDGRCQDLLCKFRTTKDHKPETMIKSMSIICPREQTYGGEEICVKEE